MRKIKLTDFHDKNGKQIREGDILQIGFVRYIVELDSDGFVTKDLSGSPVFDLCDSPRIKIGSEVIGNIYENSDFGQEKEPETEGL